MDNLKSYPPHCNKLGAEYLDNGKKYVYNGTYWQRMYQRELCHSIQTISGKLFWPFDPKIEEIDVESIAHGLALENRFANQSPMPYSVAWHSVALSHVVPDHLRQYALLHDASEAYMSDVPSPIKKQEPYASFYVAAEKILMDLVCELFEIESTPELDKYDMEMGHAEMLFLAKTNPIFLLKFEHHDIDLTMAKQKEFTHWVEQCPINNHYLKAKIAWLDRYEELFK